MKENILSLRKCAMETALEALDECAPDRLTQASLERMAREGSLNGVWSGDSKIFLLAIGKASLPMTKAAGEVFGWERLQGLVVTKKRTPGIFTGAGLKVMEGGHPLPDANSLVAGESALAALRNLPFGTPALFLISGGASALFESLVEGISLEDLRRLTQGLLRSGIPIEEINTVRTALSRVKGGKLLLEAGERECLSLILSDVVGDRPETVGSGPTVWNGDNPAERAREILKRVGLWESLSRAVREEIDREAKNQELRKPLSRFHTVLAGSNRSLCLTVARKLRSKGFSVLDQGSASTGEAKEIGRNLAVLAKEIRETGSPVSAPAAVVSGGEAVVTFDSSSSGTGGPNQEVALSFAIEAAGFSETVLLSMDTDGIDGSSDFAGGLVDGNTAERIRRAGMNARRELETHNASAALQASSDSIITGETLNNLNDLRILLVGLPDCRKG
jgi:glycerate-2-kinase